MSQSFLESEVAEEPAARSNSLNMPDQSSAALALSADDFSALEERVVRAVELVKRERQARTAAEERAAKARSAARRTGPARRAIEGRKSALCDASATRCASASSGCFPNSMP